MNDWKITIPIVRAYEREDGKLMLVGEASGPEKDQHKTRMLPEAITDFAAQIRRAFESGNPLPYMDSHLKAGAATQLGAVVNGWVNEDWHLRTEVELDELNPIARFIYDNIRLRGKQYGQSIAGTINREDMIVTKTEDGERDVAFKRVTLKEISNTSSPSWTPSLGTVLVRSLDEEQGVETMPDNLESSAPVEQEAPAAPETTEHESAEETQPDEEITERADAVEDEPPIEDEPPVEAEIARGRLSAKEKSALMEQYANLGVLLTNLGVLDAEPTETAPETPEVEHAASETGMDEELVTRIVAVAVEQAVTPLKDLVEKQAEYIEKLEKLPAGKLPPMVERKKFEDVLESLGETTEERMHKALELVYTQTR